MNFLNRIDRDITLLLDNLPVGIIRFNENRRCIYTNKYILNLLGISSNVSLDDISNLYINAIHTEDQQTEKDACNKFMSDHIECHTTIRIFNKTLNQYRWMTNKRTLVTSTETEAYSFLYTLQDVNENKLLEIQLRNETIRAERAYNHKSVFLANMSHEIRTPLNGIIGMLTLLEDSKLNTEQQDYISMVKECSYNLMTIINDILDYSKLEVGKISLDMKSMNLRECIESTNDIVLSKVYEKSLDYTYNVDVHIPDFIWGDQNRTKQVLLNLLSNSIKFTEKGSIFINVFRISQSDWETIKQTHAQITSNTSSNSSIHTCTLDQDTKSQNRTCTGEPVYIRFDLIDTGCGIDRVDQNKLFQSFSQVDNHITSKIYQGTGLGLAISRELVELMGGVIWLDWSEPGNGSRFSFVLPTSECELPQNNSVSESESVLHNANVLIVDDNLHNRISLTGMVTKWGMRPYAFSNGEEALHFTRLTQFDIGLIDICMPKIDGHAFAAKLRDQREFNNNTFPLVALSSLGDKLNSKSKHFKTHLIKPIKESKLKLVCIDLLQKRTSPKPQIVEPPIKISYLDQNNLAEIKTNVRILLAEDVYINQKVVISFLKKLGYDNIQTVDNGQQCIDTAINNEFDVILLDIRMPIMNGEIVLQELNKFYLNTKKRHRPHIVAVTAYCLREDRERYLNMGFDDYIPKPITLNELKRCFDKFIETTLYN